eukprot:6476655-Amphidinium_carterae.2
MQHARPVLDKPVSSANHYTKIYKNIAGAGPDALRWAVRTSDSICSAFEPPDRQTPSLRCFQTPSMVWLPFVNFDH